MYAPFAGNYKKRCSEAQMPYSGNVMKTIVFWVVIVLSGLLLWQVVRAQAPHEAKSPASASIQQAVRSILDVQVAAWNRGDLEAFMQGYWRSPELTFYSASGVESGWD